MKTITKAKSFNSESQLVEKLTQKLRDEGFEVWTEVSNMSQSADVVAKRGKWITMIEVKSRDWQRALVQCKAHEVVADFICVAIASSSVSVALAQQAAISGYGILHYSEGSGQFEWFLRPRLNRSVWQPQRKYWSNTARRITQHVD